MRRLVLFLSTVKYLTPAQAVARIRAMTRRLVRRVFNVKVAAPTDVRVAPHVALPIDGDPAVAEKIAAGLFSFLNIERRDPQWNDLTLPRLWRYHLQYFDYAIDLAAKGDEETFRRLSRSWIREHEIVRGDAWHPYPLSLRIVNWCRAHDAFGGDEQLARSIFGQTRFLFSNLEHDVRGNHLLKNIKALLWAGVMFEGAEAQRWFAEGLRLLEIEVAEQVLPDGCHFERVPSYHVIVLRDLEQIAELLRLNRKTPPWLDDAVARMREFLAAILGPSNRLPLFKDSTLDTPVPAVELTDGRSELRTSSGYAFIRDSGVFLVADFGRPCPPYLPAHAHADMFSYELTLDGAPLIVDSGVYEYAEGEWRDWFRSTAAHNTVEIAGENQSEVWGSFRVARRARPMNVRWSETQEGFVITGEHDGYWRLAPRVTHRRTIEYVRSKAIIVTDEILGKGTTSAASYVHFHPEAEDCSERLTVTGADVEEAEGWYSERFGEKRRNRVLILRRTGQMPFRIRYTIALE